MTARPGCRASGTAARFLLLAWLAAGCAPAVAPVDTEGKIDLLAPPPGAAATGLADDWFVEGGEAAQKHAFVAVEDGTPTLKASTGAAPILIARRTNALLLATPYLSWVWNMEREYDAIHPVRIAVGFAGGGAPGGRPAGGREWPAHDRALLLGWGASALMRGSFQLPARHDPAAPVYVVRGGRENADAWWRESVDLADLYRRLWPDGDMANVHVVFVGVATASADRPVGGSFRDIRLSR